MKTTAQRNSNMELLRIVAMLMIVAYHIWLHNMKPPLADYAGRENDYFCIPGFSVRMLLLVLVSPMGQIGDAIFLLISGYFMMTPEKKIDLTKISKKLLCQLAWATLVLVAGSGVLYHIVCRAVPVENVSLIDFYAFNNLSWYVGYYFLILVLAKLFLNRILQETSQKSYLMFLMTMFAVVQFGWSRGRLDGLISKLPTVFIGVFLYTMGGYVRRYNPFAKLRTWALVAVLIGFNIILCVNYDIATANKILQFHPENGDVFVQSVPEYEVWSFVPVMMGITLFELFRRIRLPHSRIINFLGGATFMVYLFHENSFFRRLWEIPDWITLLHDDLPKFLLTYFLWTIGTFAAGVLIYALYLLAGKLLSRCKPLAIRK